MSEWLAGHSTDWRVGRMREYPDVVVIEFPSLVEQGQAMNRIAALLEKRDSPRDRLLDDRELAALIERNGDVSATFYQGHDYGGSALARFFDLAATQRVALNPQERRLLDVLLGIGALNRSPAAAGRYLSPGVQALISFTATQLDDPSTRPDETVDERRRESVLRHEASHGVYHTQAVYRDHWRAFWSKVLTEPQRERMRHHLSTVGYDQSNQELVIDEAQAFLLHTQDTRAFSAADVGLTETLLDALREQFWRTLPVEALSSQALTAPLGGISPLSRQATAAASRP